MTTRRSESSIYVLQGLVLRLELLQRNQRRRQRFRDNPFVMALAWVLLRYSGRALSATGGQPQFQTGPIGVRV
jgi:hypothetical protein